jgi:hypothetical protein
LTAVGNIKIAGAQVGNNAKFCLTRTDASWSINNETDLRFYYGAGDTDSPATVGVAFTSTGRVGIGTTAPNRKLEVSDASADNFIRVNTTGATKSGIEFASGGTVYSQLYFYNTSPYDLSLLQQYTTGSLILGTNNTERARIDSSGRLLVGTSSARTSGLGSGISFLVEGAPDTINIGTVRNSNNANSAKLVLAKTRGSAVSSNTAVQSGDSLGVLEFDGADGTQLLCGASIEALVDATPGANDMPGRLVFSTTADGAASPTERMRIINTGAMLLGSTATSGNPTRLRVVDDSNAANSVVLIEGQSGNSATSGNIALHVKQNMDSAPIGSAALRVEHTNPLGGTPGPLIQAYGNTNNATAQRLWQVTSDGGQIVNRPADDGTLIDFQQAQTSEGTISVSGTTVSYNGAHLSRWSQLPGGAEREEILRGTVLSNIDEMCEWGEEDNEQLNRIKVSDVEGDKNVSGVFQSWDDDDDTYTNDFYCAMTGDFIIRIAEGVTVERGDLLMSAGDGTAKPQDDDIIRSKTIAKVTSTHVTCTYDDGSYCIPCVLMAC